MSTRKRDGCRACGSTETIDAVDNSGQPYKGCARCTVKSSAAGADEEHMARRRRGFWKDLASVFADARAMVGGTVRPDHMTEERERITALERELRRELKAADFAHALAMELLGDRRAMLAEVATLTAERDEARGLLGRIWERVPGRATGRASAVADVTRCMTEVADVPDDCAELVTLIADTIAKADRESYATGRAAALQKVRNAIGCTSQGQPARDALADVETSLIALAPPSHTCKPAAEPRDEGEV